MTLVTMLLPYLVAALMIGGGAIPVIVAAITGLHWPGWLKQIIMIVVAVVVGTATWLSQNGLPDWGSLDQAKLGALIIGIIGAAHLAYNYLWMSKIAPAVASARSKLTSKLRTRKPAPVIEPADVEEPGDDASGNAAEKMKPL